MISVRATMSPARLILVAIAFPPSRLEFCALADRLTDSQGLRVPALLYTARPAVLFTKRPRSAPSYVHAAL
jgi:hypothetical protein